MTDLERRCENPRCTCVPCTCDDCKCGRTHLGDLERRVMDVLWSRPDSELTARDVVDRLPEYAYTTVATVLGRLARKGEVTRRRDGRVVIFRTTSSPASHASRAMQEALEDAPDPAEALTEFVAALPAEHRSVLDRALRV